MKLTEKQKNVIECPPNIRSLVEAGPGTGKTEVVARRLEWLLSSGGLRPSQILILSFSRAAVKALVNRVSALEGIKVSTVEEMRHLAIRTFDSWAFRMLRFWGDPPADLLAKTHDENIKALTKRLRAASDLESIPSDTLLKNIRHVIVDEFQDLTGVRALLVKELLGKLSPPGNNPGTHCGFTLLGDSHQAIYEWTQQKQEERFSSRDLISWVKSTYARHGLEKRSLAGNHRSEGQIASFVREAAHKISMAEEEGRDPYVEVCALLDQEHREQLSDVVLQMSEGDADTGVAVLCRYNRQVVDIGIRFAKEMKRAELGGLNFILDINSGDSRRHLPPWIAGMLHRFRVNQLSKSNFKRVYEEFARAGQFQMPCSGRWEETWKLLLRCAQKPETDTSIQMDELRERLTWPDSLPDDEDCGIPRVIVTTVHKSKGLEYDLVRLVEPGGVDDCDPSEEARVLFVGLSRARHELALLGGEMELDLQHRSFSEGRRMRWHHWHDVKYRGASRSLEIGIEGDVCRESFVSPGVLGGAAAVQEVQDFLLGNSRVLAGEEVVLNKIENGSKKYAYNIVLPGRGNLVIGRMSDSLKYDLLDVKHNKQSLPASISGLRINRVTTCIAGNPVPADIPEPWRTSGLWAGVDIHGMGSFMTYWYKN